MENNELRFEDFTLDLAAFELRHAGAVVEVEPQVFSVLSLLARNPNRLITRDEILDEVWGHRHVSDSAVSTRIKAARQALNDDGKQQRLIKTVHGKGFRFLQPDAQPGQTIPSTRHNLPHIRTPIFGRDVETIACAQSVAAHRLVSTVGMGGTGKTRLAVEVARAAEEPFPDGRWLIDLVPCIDRRSIETTMAHAAAIPLTTGRLDEQLTAALGERSVLFVLDNCEHVLSDVADTVNHLLDTTPNVHFLITSREPLRIDGEYEVHVEPLATEAPDRGLSPALSMLIDCAHRAGVAIATQDHEQALALCRRLDGLPLAIDLAAAQLRHFRLDELASRLDQQLDLLTEQRQADSDRQSSLSAVIESTYAQLGQDAQVLLRLLGVFPGPFEISDVDALAEGLVANIPQAFGKLVNHALVSRRDQHARQWRVLETVKHFAHQNLDPNELDALAKRHAEWVLAQVDFPLQEFYWSYDIAAWTKDHYLDLQAADRYFFDHGRYENGAHLILSQTLAMNFDIGPLAAATLRRVNEYSTKLEAGELLALLHCTGVYCARVARSNDDTAWHGVQAMNVASRTDSPFARASALFVSSWMALFTDPDRAQSKLDAFLDVATDIGGTEWEDVGVLFTGYLLAFKQRWQALRETLEPVYLRVAADPDAPITHATNAVLRLLIAASAPSEPKRALELFHLMNHGVLADAWDSHFLRALAEASNRNATATLEACQVMRARLKNAQFNYGEELMIPSALLALRSGDRERAQEWLAAVNGRVPHSKSFYVPIALASLAKSFPELALEPDSGVDRTAEELNATADAALQWMEQLVQ